MQIRLLLTQNLINYMVRILAMLHIEDKGGGELKLSLGEWRGGWEYRVVQRSI